MLHQFKKYHWIWCSSSQACSTKVEPQSSPIRSFYDVPRPQYPVVCRFPQRIFSTLTWYAVHVVLGRVVRSRLGDSKFNSSRCYYMCMPFWFCVLKTLPIFSEICMYGMDTKSLSSLALSSMEMGLVDHIVAISIPSQYFDNYFNSWVSYHYVYV